ncbi:MAG TPA: lycopene cyclase family protein [Aggregatilineales bacterium]|nr:lycopene cyclase family protein [Aggregatilineales bacterium]
MKTYDFIFAGAGIAGLSLAVQLAHSPLHDRSMLLIDKADKERNDRTLCFWTDQPTPFDSIVFRSWDKLRFVGEEGAQQVNLKSYRYKMIRGIDFYQFARQELAVYPSVEFLHGTVDSITEGPDGAVVCADGQMYAGKWVFDSRFTYRDFRPDPERYHSLQQHFKGCLIETPVPAFSTDAATYMDFSTPQKNEMRFLYVLPLSATQALIECVLMSHDHYDQVVKTYVESALDIRDYRIVAEEGGINPLTDYPFPRRLSSHVMTIGTLGGRIKPTSGYAFLRIQSDSAAIVRSLQQVGHPFDIPRDSGLFRLLDSVMLHVMTCRGGQLKSIFTGLFQNNPIERVFHLLDESASLGEILQVMASVPPLIFLQALFQVAVKRWL